MSEEKPLSPAPEICPLHFGVPTDVIKEHGFYKNYAPFAYRVAKRSEVMEIKGTVGGWANYWAVVDNKGRAFLIKKGETQARNAASELTYLAAKEIMAGSNQPES